MLNKTVIPSTMHVTVIFFVLFKISFGFHLNFDLAQFLDGLHSGHSLLFPTKHFRESKSIQSDPTSKPETSSNDKFAINAGINLEDSLKAVSDTASGALQTIANISRHSLQTAGEKATAAGSILKDSLENVAEKAGKELNGSILKDPLKTVGDLGESSVGKASSSIQGDSLETVGVLGASLVDKASNSIQGDPLETVGVLGESIVSKASSSSLGNPIETVSVLGESTLGKALNASVLKDPVETAGGLGGSFVGKASAGILGDSLETVSGKADVSVLDDPLKSLSEKAGKTLKSSVLADSFIIGSDASILEDSLKVTSEKAGKSLNTNILGDPLNALSEKAGKALSGGLVEGSLKTGSEKVIKTINGAILGDPLKVLTEKASKSLTGNVLKDPLTTLPIKGGKTLNVGLLNDGLGKVAGKAHEALHGVDFDSSLEAVSEISSKTIQGGLTETYLGAITEKAGVNSNENNLEDPLQTVAGKAGSTLSGGITGISLTDRNLEGTLTGGIQEAIGGINHDFAVDPLNDAISEMTTDVKCTTKSPISFASVPSVSKFVNTFYKAVQSSELLSILFNVTDATPLQFSRFNYRYISDFFRKLGFVYHKELATFAVRPITRHFKVLNLHVLQKVYSSLFAQYLFAEAILTDGNAEKLAKALLNAFLESAKSNHVESDCDFTRKFQAASDAKSSFLLSLGDISITQAWEMVFYYAHSWLLAAVDFGAIKVLNVEI